MNFNGVSKSFKQFKKCMLETSSFTKQFIIFIAQNSKLSFKLIDMST